MTQRTELVRQLRRNLTIAIWELALAIKQKRGDHAIDFHDSNRANINKMLLDLAEGWGQG